MKNHIQVGVGAIVMNEQGQLFLAQRGHNVAHEQGYWEFPGGAVEFGEGLVDAVRREIDEEYGIIIDVTELVGVYEQMIDGEHWISPTYIAHLVSGEACIQEPDTCIAIGWFHPQEIPQPLTKISQSGLKDYLAKNTKS
jgi:8-oxo-dGTP diphosphatase